MMSSGSSFPVLPSHLCFIELEPFLVLQSLKKCLIYFEWVLTKIVMVRGEIILLLLNSWYLSRQIVSSLVVIKNESHNYYLDRVNVMKPEEIEW